jgi:hypothetical protein
MPDRKNTFSDLDPQKRETLRKLVLGTAFAFPVIASFSMREVSLLGANGYANNNQSGRTNWNNYRDGQNTEGDWNNYRDGRDTEADWTNYRDGR